MRYDINAIYYLVDEFCKIYLNWHKHKLIPSENLRDRSGRMSLSEMLTIMIIYHLSPAREFKFFYLYYLTPKHQKDFPNLISYNRFVEIKSTLLVPLITMLHCMSGARDNVYFIDSTSYFITFVDNDVIEKTAQLKIIPTPDTVIRILMDFKPLDKEISVPELQLPEVPQRKGFTVIEWGGLQR